MLRGREGKGFQRTKGRLSLKSAGGAPNLKRVIDLTRIACAAQLLENPGFAVQTVVKVLHFTSSNHLARTARRIANVTTGGLGKLGPGGVLAAFVRGNTRSRN